MKTGKYFVRLTICCQLLLALYACEKNDWAGENMTCNVVVDRTETVDETVPLESLSYTLCLFRAKIVAEGKLSDTDFKCLKLKTGLNKETVDSYSWKINNQDIGDYEYRLFLHATPKVEEKTETTVLGVEQGSSIEQPGSSYDAIEISMVTKENGDYIPLSRNNYYASTNLTVDEMINGITTIKLSLKRLVGQLAFDFFKSDESSGDPLDIKKDYLSTLDRVSQITVKVEGMTSKIKLAGMVAFEDENKQISHQFDTTLEKDYRLEVANQKAENIVKVTKQKGNGTVEPRGGARVFSVYLLPTVTTDNNRLKANLTFQYYDTPVFNDTPIKKELKLQLPSTQNGVLCIKENCYTLTNVRLKNDRIIDLNASGGVEIDTEWDKWSK